MTQTAARHKHKYHFAYNAKEMGRQHRVYVCSLCPKTKKEEMPIQISKDNTLTLLGLNYKEGKGR